MIPVVYQNQDFVVFNKPQGMNFHSEDGEVGFVVQATSQLKVKQLFSVHRLDKMTISACTRRRRYILIHVP